MKLLLQGLTPQNPKSRNLEHPQAPKSQNRKPASAEYLPNPTPQALRNPAPEDAGERLRFRLTLWAVRQRVLKGV